VHLQEGKAERFTKEAGGRGNHQEGRAECITKRQGKVHHQEGRTECVIEEARQSAPPGGQDRVRH